jgi:hypothetical protein
MSNLQKLLTANANELERSTILPYELSKLSRSLDGINSLYHEELVLAAFGLDAKEEQPRA